MFSVRRRGAARLAAVTLASGLVAAGVLAGAGAAVADEEPQRQGGATATLGSLVTHDQAVIRGEDGNEREIPAGLFEMSVQDGGTLQSYCVDIHNPTQQGAKYQETPWSATSLNNNPDAGKVHWILRNSYPQVNDLAALAKKSGARSLTEETAAAGTQVAIWRYSDGADVTAVDPGAEKLADYLEKRARNHAEPKASLTLDPPAVSGHPGKPLGPVTVRTSADEVMVSPPTDATASGVRIVDAKGEELTSAKNGDELYFDVPKDAALSGSAALTVQASTTVPVGRAFASETRSQTQILAGSSESTVAATASAHWAEQGPIPALSAQKNCAKGGVDIAASNVGDEPFTFELMGFKHTIGAGKSQTVTIPLQEDQAYDFTITGPNGFEKRIKGVLDCATAGSPAGDTPEPSDGPSPASIGGTGTTDDLNLADTGSSNATPMIAGIAVALVVVGGAAVFFLRKKDGSGE
ncbi:Cys-Gln thioester bond-forming surface protein [Streptomyces apocyni]|uniref:Cys-Gln thioester bond-forming surface protein n=1 Tax=Streptomyces apocyni TaxID=2654677 RepID=UPI0012E9BF88|nr:Cys-Gln thioester bond-forming surface protein [Streptomyces apocyni]